MGLIQKKDERDVLDGIEIIGRGEGPDPDAVSTIDLVAGKTAEDISGTTAAKDEGMETEPDPELLADIEDETESEEDSDADSEGGDDQEPEDTAADESEHAPARKEKPVCDPKAPSPSKMGRNHGRLFIAIAVIAVVIAAIAGFIVGNGGIGAKGTGSATLTEDQLDTTVATWSYKGATHQLSAREAIESQYSLDTVKGTDGTYPAPSASSIVTYVQNQILLADAESRGITVSDDEAAQSVEKTLQTSDWSEIAKQYGVSEDQAKEIVKQNTMVQKLYAQVVPDAATMPTEPTAPADGNQDAASKEYADYIIDLAGDEWDKDKATWKDTDGAIASALKDQQFTVDSATYSQAMMAYYAAYQNASSKSSDARATWTKYANGLLAHANVQLYGVYA